MEVKDENGSNFIPASQRPDGTWRKPRRVKEGYVPQEEVPLYESKGKQFLNRKAQQKLPPGFADAPDIKPKRIPGYTVEEKPKKDKKKSKTAPVVEDITKSLSEIKLEEPAAQDPVKKLKNLKKRLREIEALELKINAGDIKNPEKEQLDKVGRKKEVIKEIRIIEASIPSDK